ncbi:c-type cytochrome [Zunongwangia sp.]|uniref:c-type cytochrome n=1 Tax=Zunongwangia sp. TaxID=1965325 RepID=UPI003AA891D6
MKKILSIALILGAFACKNNEKNSQNKTQKNYTTTSEVKSTGNTDLDISIAKGKSIYNKLCATCHLPSGKGIPGTYPPLDGSNWLTEKRKASIKAVKFGLQGPITVNGKEYNNVMTNMGLTDKQVADALNYSMNSWSNSNTDMITPEEVAQIEK